MTTFAFLLVAVVSTHACAITTAAFFVFTLQTELPASPIPGVAESSITSGMSFALSIPDRACVAFCAALFIFIVSIHNIMNNQTIIASICSTLRYICAYIIHRLGVATAYLPVAVAKAPDIVGMGSVACTGRSSLTIGLTITDVRVMDTATVPIICTDSAGSATTVIAPIPRASTLTLSLHHTLSLTSTIHALSDDVSSIAIMAISPVGAVHVFSLYGLCANDKTQSKQQPQRRLGQL